MKWTMFGRAVLAVMLLVVVSVGVIAAQDNQPNDGRINQGFFLGGLALYCNDPNGGIALNYDQGGISLWGAGGTQYLFVAGDDLNGDTDTTTQTTQTGSNVSSPSGAAAQNSALVIPANPNRVLLAVGTGQFGPVAFYRLAPNVFQLLFNDQHGKQFSFIWSGCTAENARLEEFFGTIPTSLTGSTRQSTQSTPTATVNDTNDAVNTSAPTSAADVTVTPTSQG